MALLKLKTELENALARASKTSTKLHAPQESPAIFFKILVEDEEIEEWWRFMTLDCVVVGFCLWKERWLRSCRTSQQTCHNIPSYCNTHVFRIDIHMSVCSELMLRGFAANQLNNEILALKWGPFAFFISGSMHNERMMRNANLKIRVVFKKMCFHVAATRRCAIHLTNTYNILQQFTTSYNSFPVFPLLREYPYCRVSSVFTRTGFEALKYCSNHQSIRSKQDVYV